MTSMNQLVWRDYRRALKRKRAWEWISELNGFVYEVIGCFLLLLRISLDIEGIGFLYFGIGVAPIIFTVVSAMCVELQLPKHMYLIPLTREERREYMEKLLRLKIVFPNVILTLVIVSMVVAGLGNWSLGVMLIIQSIFTTMGMSLFYIKELPDKSKEIRAEGSMIWSRCIMSWGFTIELIILRLFCTNMIVKMNKEIWIFWGISVIVQIFFLYKIYSRKNQYFENMANYERLWEKAKGEEAKARYYRRNEKNYRREEKNRKDDEYEIFDIYDIYDRYE